MIIAMPYRITPFGTALSFAEKRLYDQSLSFAQTETNIVGDGAIDAPQKAPLCKGGWQNRRF